MYFDAQYTFPELAEKANWGHSAAQIQDLKAQTTEYFQWRLEHAAESGETVPNIIWDFVHEGLEVRIG